MRASSEEKHLAPAERRLCNQPQSSQSPAIIAITWLQQSAAFAIRNLAAEIAGSPLVKKPPTISTTASEDKNSHTPSEASTMKRSRPRSSVRWRTCMKALDTARAAALVGGRSVRSVALGTALSDARHGGSPRSGVEGQWKVMEVSGRSVEGQWKVMEVSGRSWEVSGRSVEGHGRSVEGRWKVMEGEWKVSGRAVEGQWKGSGRSAEGRGRSWKAPHLGGGDHPDRIGIQVAKRTAHCEAWPEPPVALVRVDA